MFESKRYRAFWKWFECNNHLLLAVEGTNEQVFDTLHEQLLAVDENLTFEIGPPNTRPRELILSADGIRESFPAVEKLFELRPPLENWTIIKFRPRMCSGHSIVLGEVELSPKNSYFRLFKDDDKLGILLFLENYDKDTPEFCLLPYLLLDTILGEYDVETKVGRLRFLTTPLSILPVRCRCATLPNTLMPPIRSFAARKSS